MSGIDDGDVTCLFVFFLWRSMGLAADHQLKSTTPIKLFNEKGEPVSQGWGDVLEVSIYPRIVATSKQNGLQRMQCYASAKKR